MANWLVVLACVVIFFLQVVEIAEHATGRHATASNASMLGPFETWLLSGWSLKGLLGHMWLHGGLIHLLGNMWFLWVFGNAVCANVGNLKYPLVYVTLGVAAGMTHLMVSSHPVLGASGAINGIVGMYLVMFPQNEITCYFWFCLVYVRQFAISGYWLILFWLFWDILGALRWGDSGVAYAAHLGGFAAGAGLGILFCAKDWCLLDKYDRSLVRIWRERRKHQDKKPFDPVFSARGLTIDDSATSEFVTESGPVAPRRPSIPMLDLNDGTPIPEGWPGQVCTCGQRITVSKQYAGKLVRCPRCKAPVQIPSDQASDPSPPSKTGTTQAGNGHSPEMIRFACPCGQKIKIPARYGGRSGKCPRCGARLQIPSP